MKYSILLLTQRFILQAKGKFTGQMLKECLENEEFAAASKSQGPQRSTESMFMALIFQQQKMISKLIKQIEQRKK